MKERNNEREREREREKEREMYSSSSDLLSPLKFTYVSY